MTIPCFLVLKSSLLSPCCCLHRSTRKGNNEFLGTFCTSEFVHQCMEGNNLHHRMHRVSDSHNRKALHRHHTHRRHPNASRNNLQNAMRFSSRSQRQLEHFVAITFELSVLELSSLLLISVARCIQIATMPTFASLGGARARLMSGSASRDSLG